MPLQHLGFVDLPAHAGDGGFDHAAVHEPTGRVYVAHTANDAVDIIDIESRKLIGSIEGLTALAGALVAEPDLVFTSNRGENTVGIFRAGDLQRVEKVAVGVRPNGLAYDPRRGRLLAAHVGDPAIPGSTFPWRDARAGPSMIRSPTPSTSTSPILRRSSSSLPTIRSASAVS
jgi:DNA-binding beta-propeller fold protein YncE